MLKVLFCDLMAKFGWPLVLGAALVYIILGGRINGRRHFQYPREPDDPKTPLPKPPAQPKKELSSGD